MPSRPRVGPQNPLQKAPPSVIAVRPSLPRLVWVHPGAPCQAKQGLGIPGGPCRSAPWTSRGSFWGG